MGYLSHWMEHYKYMPNAEGDELFQERINELRRDREFDRVVAHYNCASTAAIERFLNEMFPFTLTPQAEYHASSEYYAAKDHQYVRGSRTTYNTSIDISEDELLLGKEGAAVIRKAEPHFDRYNRYVWAAKDRCASEFKKAQNALKALGLNSPMMAERFHDIDGRFVRLERAALEVYILEHPDESAKDVINVIETKHRNLQKRVDTFLKCVKATVQNVIDTIIYGPKRESILKRYRKEVEKLEQHPLESFLDIATRDYSKDQPAVLNYIGWDIGGKLYHAKIYRIAWVMSITGFEHIRSSWSTWPYEIDTVEDFVVIAHMIFRRNPHDRYHALRFCQYLKTDQSNEFLRASRVKSAIAKIQNTYNRYNEVDESGIKEVYTEYMTLVETAFEKRGDTTFLSEFIPNILQVIEQRSKKTIELMDNLNQNHIASLNAARIRQASTVYKLDDEVSPYDYEYILKVIIPQMAECSYCRDGDSRIGYRAFKITDQIVEAGIGLCLVLKALKSYVGSVSVSASGRSYKFNKNAYDGLYNLLRHAADSDTPFMMSGLIFWNVEDTDILIDTLYRSFDFL
ncbi:MAG: hypothetical protein NC489_08420 [Ruminococcus flavefaciens]|nr:hypothetical protein [Ruminococcus flavefaciens]